MRCILKSQTKFTVQCEISVQLSVRVSIAAKTFAQPKPNQDKNENRPQSIATFPSYIQNLKHSVKLDVTVRQIQQVLASVYSKRTRFAVSNLQKHQGWDAIKSQEVIFTDEKENQPRWPGRYLVLFAWIETTDRVVLEKQKRVASVMVLACNFLQGRYLYEWYDM